MNMTVFVAVLSAVAAMSGIILGWWARARTVKTEIKTDAAGLATIQNDIAHIKCGIDEIKEDLRSGEALFRSHCDTDGQKLNGLTQRVTRVEEVARSAHKRIDGVGALAVNR